MAWVPVGRCRAWARCSFGMEKLFYSSAECDLNRSIMTPFL